MGKIIERIRKLHQPLAEVSSRMDLVIRRVGDEKLCVSELEQHSRAMDARIAELKHTLERTLEHLEDLEHGRLFSRDVLVAGLKEGTEWPDPVKFFETWVPDVLGMHIRNNR